MSFLADAYNGVANWARGDNNWHTTMSVFAAAVRDDIADLVGVSLTNNVVYSVASPSSAVDIALTAASGRIQRVTMTAASKSVILPDATTVVGGMPCRITNAGSNTFDVKDFGGTVLMADVAAGSTVTYALADGATQAGVWHVEITSATIAVASASPLQIRRIAWNSLQLLLTTSISTGAWLNGQLWELLSDEWGATSTNETYDATGNFYHNAGTYTVDQCTGGTASANVEVAPASNAVDDDFTISYWHPNVVPAWWQYTFAASKAIRKVVLYPNAGQTITGSIQYWNGSAWAESGATFTAASNPTTIYPTSGDSTQWRVNITAASVSNFSVLEIEMMEALAAVDMTLVSPAITAPASAVVEQTTYFLWNDISTTAVLGTDLTVTHSNDGNTTKGTATLTDLGDFDGTYKLVEAKTATGMGTGTTPVVEIKTLNAKEQRIKPHVWGYTN